VGKLGALPEFEFQGRSPLLYSGKTADWIQMPFGMMSGVGRGMGVLDVVVIVEGEGLFRG